MLAAIQHWASEFGGVGLFVLAALDSSFLSFPQVTDLLVIYLSVQHPERMTYYAGMSTAGSLLGCLMLYGVARKGGEVFLRRRFNEARVDRVMTLSQRFGLLAVVVPALLPPPAPFKLFVLIAGAAAVAPWRFSVAILIGRGIRYFGQGYLAVRYGERAVDLVRQHGAQVGLALAAAVLVAALVLVWVRRQRTAARRVDSSEGSNRRYES
jgi:membrane protein YqaA with SNARE-associated domain